MKIREITQAVTYSEPKLDYEWKEAQRYPALAKLGLEGWKKLKGEEVNVKDLGGLQKIGNHSAPDQNTANKNLPNLEQGKVKRTQAMVKSGQVELPIVVKLPNGKMDLLGGNTRFTSLVAMGIIPNVWYIDASGLKENFQLKEATVQDVIRGYLNSEIGKKYARYDCKTVTRAFLKWAKEKNIPTQVLFLAPPSAETIKQNPQFKGKSGTGDAHIMPVVSGQAIDFTVRQFPGKQGTPYEKPLITPVGQVKQVYNKLGGYYTDAPAWMNNKSDYLGSTLPPSIAKMDFGDELLENFADKKVKGKSRPGRVKRAGASCSGSVTSLRAKAKRYSGEKGKMYHWCANMKSGKSK